MRQTEGTRHALAAVRTTCIQQKKRAACVAPCMTRRGSHLPQLPHLRTGPEPGRRCRARRWAARPGWAGARAGARRCACSTLCVRTRMLAAAELMNETCLASADLFQVSTMCVAEGLVAAGGFGGELVVKALGAPPANALVYAGRVTNRCGRCGRSSVPWRHLVVRGTALTHVECHPSLLLSCNCSENGITNGLEVFSSPQHGACVVASNNDAMVRMYSTQGGGFRWVLWARRVTDVANSTVCKRFVAVGQGWPVACDHEMRVFARAADGLSCTQAVRALHLPLGRQLCDHAP